MSKGVIFEVFPQFKKVEMTGLTILVSSSFNSVSHHIFSDIVQYLSGLSFMG